MKSRIFELGFLSLLLCGALFVRAADNAKVKGDNSARNQRDRTEAAVTAESQGTESSDIEITRKIREEIVARKDLSTNAHNVKIITRNGFVTLRGPVASKSEEEVVRNSAAKVVGLSKVKNELEIVRAD